MVIPVGVTGALSPDSDHPDLVLGFLSWHRVTSFRSIWRGLIGLSGRHLTVGYFAGPLPILNILVPQTGQTPRVAGRPFFIVICSVSFIVLFSRHFMQYPSIVLSLDISTY